MDEGAVCGRPPACYGHKTVCHARGECAHDEDGDRFCKRRVNTVEEFWSLLRF